MKHNNLITNPGNADKNNSINKIKNLLIRGIPVFFLIISTSLFTGCSSGSDSSADTSDNTTGLMWQKSPDTNGDGDILADDKYSYDEAVANAAYCNTAGYTDWRLPTIKELYSLMQFSGEDVSSETLNDTDSGMEMENDFEPDSSSTMEP